MPARLLPPSTGIKEGDNTRCRYHGLLIGSDGAAVQMPVRTEKTHKSVCTKSCPIAERHHFVWIWIGESSKAAPSLTPDFWPCSDPNWTFDAGYYPIKCDYRLFIDNLMDLHETYVHHGSIGQPEISETTIETRAEGDHITGKPLDARHRRAALRAQCSSRRGWSIVGKYATS